MINTAAKLSEQALMKSSNSDSIKRCVVLFKFCIPDHGNSESKHFQLDFQSALGLFILKSLLVAYLMYLVYMAKTFNEYWNIVKNGHRTGCVKHTIFICHSWLAKMVFLKVVNMKILRDHFCESVAWKWLKRKEPSAKQNVRGKMKCINDKYGASLNFLALELGETFCRNPNSSQKKAACFYYH